MDAKPHPSHSFILKIWLEHTVEEAGQAEWRGHLTHVPDGQRRYIRSLAELASALAPYLEDMGITLQHRHRLPRWLLRLHRQNRA